jgi:hypothetical protein
VLRECAELSHARPAVQVSSPADELQGLLERVGNEHTQWLKKLAESYRLIQEPIFGADGEIIAQPLFWFEALMGKHCCFGRTELGQLTRNRLEDNNIVVLVPGQPFI